MISRFRKYVHTRKHSSRIRTANRTYFGIGGRGCPQVNKFGQVCSDGHQMSLVTSKGSGGGVLMSGGWLYSEDYCIMGSGHMDTSENITFPQLCWRAVIITSA